MTAPRIAVAALCLAVVGCARPAPTQVDPADYDAYFLWAGVKPSTVLERTRTLYLLAGEVRADDGGQLVSLRPVPPRVRAAEVWMTIRIERLDWQESTYRRVLRDLDRWNAAGNAVAGLQIDFDARTRGLSRYAAFLADLRGRLPRRYRLSVTGLMDWSAQGDPRALARMAGTVDEAVIQTYQGRRTIPGYERYMASLERLPMPYRVALVERGIWREPPALTGDPEFKGYVVFLLPE